MTKAKQLTCFKKEARVKVKKAKMTRKVIEQIIEIDKEFYLNFNYETDCDWYFKRYSKNNNIFLLIVDNKIVGYFLFYSISQNLFNEILNLKYEGDYNFPENEVNVKTDLYYIPSVLVLKSYRKYCVPLLKALFNETAKKKNLIAITVSNEGRRMARRALNLVGTANKEKGILVYAKTTKSAL